MNDCRSAEESSAPAAERRKLLAVTFTLTCVQVLLGVIPAVAAPRSGARVEVWKSPTCECCSDWIRHLEREGFRVRVSDVGNTAARGRLGIPAELGSCHTALVEGYALEGHVPVREVRRLLNERPRAIGLAVAGMSRGSPGMDGPEYNGRRDPYDVQMVMRDGTTRIYQSYRTPPTLR